MFEHESSLQELEADEWSARRTKGRLQWLLSQKLKDMIEICEAIPSDY